MFNIGSVLNETLGFATNSSSRHYALWKANRSQHEGDYPEDWWFGRKFKKYGTLKEKMAYGIAQVLGVFDLTLDWPENGYTPKRLHELQSVVRISILSEVCDLLEISEIEKDEIMILGRGMEVDQQSQIYFPHVKGEKWSPNIQFIREWWAWIQRPEVIIYTDDDEKHDTYQGDRYIAANLREYHATKDEESGSWILFNEKNGKRIITSFDETYKVYDYLFYQSYQYHQSKLEEKIRMKTLKLSFPVLVDMKITERCGENCDFCYQDSKPEGDSVSLESIKKIAQTLKDVGTSEVALSGGDPTICPGLKEIVAILSKAGVIVNITTRRLSYIDYNIQSMINDYGAVGWSYDGKIENLLKFISIKKNKLHRDQWHKLLIHYVMGLESFDRFKGFLEVCAENVLDGVVLLGFKPVGRGAGFEKYDYSGWVKKIFDETKLFGSVGISADTLFLKECPEICEKIDPRYYMTEEGKVSCYIDAVRSKIACNSYSAELIPWDMEKDTLLREFKRF